MSKLKKIVISILIIAMAVTSIGIGRVEAAKNLTGDTSSSVNVENITEKINGLDILITGSSIARGWWATGIGENSMATNFVIAVGENAVNIYCTAKGRTIYTQNSMSRGTTKNIDGQSGSDIKQSGKTDATGNRMFEVKDIIKFIRESEKDIAKADIKDKTSKSVFTKSYYSSLHDGLVEKYGKLTPKKRATKKA